MPAAFPAMSPALKRLYRRSALPMAVALAAIWAMLHAAQPMRTMALAVAIAMFLWLFWLYLRFLRECDELERRIEQLAMSWAMCAGMLIGGVLLFAIDAGLLLQTARQSLAWVLLAIGIPYVAARWLLHWYYR